MELFSEIVTKADDVVWVCSMIILLFGTNAPVYDHKDKGNPA